MPPPIRRRLKPGQTPTAAEWNAVVELLALSGALTGTTFGDIGIVGGAGGPRVLDGREAEHWAKIGEKGTGAAYAHTQAVPDGDGTFTDLPPTSDYIWGTTTSAPAREVNGNEDVPEGSYARLWPDPVGNGGFLFDGSGIAAAAGSSGGPAPGGCGWLAGLRGTECLALTVLSAAGRCACIDTDQTVLLRFSEDDQAWVPRRNPEDPEYVGMFESCSEELLAARFTALGCHDYCLTLTADGGSGGEVTHHLFFDHCGPNYVVFAGGGDDLCGGEGDDCGDNVFRVKIACGGGECFVTLPCIEAALPETGGTLPRRLWLTVIDESPGGECAGFAGVFPLDHHVPGLPVWFSPSTPGFSNMFAFQCDGSVLDVLHRAGSGMAGLREYDILSEVPLLIEGFWYGTGGFMVPNTCLLCTGFPGGLPPCGPGTADPPVDCLNVRYILSESPP